jgi:hypothetical protein
MSLLQTTERPSTRRTATLVQGTVTRSNAPSRAPCPHHPRCAAPDAVDHGAARVVASHPERISNDPHPGAATGVHWRTFPTSRLLTVISEVRGMIGGAPGPDNSHVHTQIGQPPISGRSALR